MRFTRFTLMLILGLVSLILMACTPGASMDIEALLTKAQAEITLQGPVTADIDLPTNLEVDEQTILVEWSSDNPEIITAEGLVNRPTYDVGDVSVTLTATFTYENQTKVAPFVVVVQALGAPTFTVTFDANAGSSVASQTVEINQIAEEPNAPTKPGYDFLEWVDDADEVFDFSTPITSNMTLYATYEVVNYDISYVYDQAATIISPGDTTYTIESTDITLGEVSIENGTFVGWATDPLGDEVVEMLDPLTLDDVTLYAIFEMDPTYTVTFNPNNETSAFDVTMYSGYINAPDEPTKTGYTFDGWYKNIEDTDPFNFENELITLDTTLYAKWLLETYTITYMLDMGLVELPNPTTYTIETPDIVLNDATKTYYDFVDWTVNDDPIDTIKMGTTGDLVLYATYTPKSYTITYEADGGMPTSPLKDTYTYVDETFELPPLEKTGYYFDGWYDSAEEGNKITSITENTFGDMTLYARFYEVIEINYMDEVEVNVAQTYEVYFEGNLTSYIVDENGRIYAQGSNQLGLLGVGESIQYADDWIPLGIHHMFEPNEYITHHYFEAPMIILITSNNRVITWGFKGFEMDQPVVNYEPTDITDLFNLNGAAIKDASHLFYHFVVITTDDRILMYGGSVTDVTPTSIDVETLKISENFGGGEFKYSNVLIADDKIFVHPIGTSPELLEVSSEFNFAPLEEVIFVMAQGEGIHVLTNEGYYFMMVMPGEMSWFEYQVMNVDLTLNLNPGETVISSVGGGGLFTSDNRILLPTYVVENTEDEMPSEVIYHDVTDQLELALGEVILNVYESLFIHTSNHQLLLLMMGDSFTTDPLMLPEVEMMTIDILAYMLTGDEPISIQMSQSTLSISIDGVAYGLIFEQSGIHLEPVVIEATSVIHQADTPIHMLQSFYAPPEKPFKAFEGWYLDQAYTVLATKENTIPGMQLFAKWVDTHYTIYFEMGFEYVGQPYEPYMGELGSIPTAPEDPSRPYYTFDGWYYFDESDQFSVYTFDEPLNQNITLYASFVPNTYDITFNFDLTDTSALGIAWSYMHFEDIYMNVPNGYEVVGVYFDEMMTIPVASDYEILDDQTFYVALAAHTYDVYYYETTSMMAFDELFKLYENEFGLTSDGRLFGRGSNYNGLLGLDTDIAYFQEFVELTQNFNLEVSETIVRIESTNGVPVLYTSEGNVFMWGYSTGNNMYQKSPVNITQMLQLDPLDPVIYVYSEYDQLYIYTASGMVYYKDFGNALDATYDLIYPLDKPKFVTRFGFNETYLLVFETNIIVVEFDVNTESIQVTDYTNLLNNQSVVDVVINTFNGQGYFAVLTDGTIIGMNTTDFLIDIFDMIDLNTAQNEFIDQVFFNGNDILVRTNLNNYYQTTQQSTTLIDSSILGTGEHIIGYSAYTGNYYTNLGESYYFDWGNTAFGYIGQFAPHDGINDYVKTVYINNNDYLLNEVGVYVALGQQASEATFHVAYDLVIETPTTGTPYTFRVPDGRVDKVFDGWYVTLTWQEEANQPPMASDVYYGVWQQVVA